MICRKCYYELRGLEAGGCPECGRAFDPSDPVTFRATVPPSRGQRSFLLLEIIVGLGLLPLAGFIYGAWIEGGEFPVISGLMGLGVGGLLSIVGANVAIGLWFGERWVALARFVVLVLAIDLAWVPVVCLLVLLGWLNA